MNSPEKQLKYSIRKVSIGAASVVIGALYLLMGAGVAHAEDVGSAREVDRTANPTDTERSGDGETGNKAALDNTDAVEEMWKIIQHMPDDFQNNERSYLRNMDTLGDELNLKPGEIRELHDFGGWHAIDKDGTKGKFVIGRKNEQGYFTGWRKVGETAEGIPIIEQGGMLGADALDNIYVHEQALDRRFNYMLMLVKGRTRTNRNEVVSDKTQYNPKAENERANMTPEAFNKLPFLKKDKVKKYSPGVVGYNGIEKQFTAFSTKYGSRVRVEFVTGYVSDINGSKGSYRVIINTQDSQGRETKVYDETIHRIAEIIQNEDLYKKCLDVETTNKKILGIFEDEVNAKFLPIFNSKKASSTLSGKKDQTIQKKIKN